MSCSLRYLGIIFAHTMDLRLASTRISLDSPILPSMFTPFTQLAPSEAEPKCTFTHQTLATPFFESLNDTPSFLNTKLPDTKPHKHPPLNHHYATPASPRPLSASPLPMEHLNPLFLIPRTSHLSIPHAQYWRTSHPRPFKESSTSQSSDTRQPQHSLSQPYDHPTVQHSRLS